MGTIHISEADAVRDFAGLPARVRAGIEIVIDSGIHPAAVLRAAAPPRRSISESIALAEARSKELGYRPLMDADFAADMEEFIRNAASSLVLRNTSPESPADSSRSGIVSPDY